MVEICVVGAGIVGLSTATLLQESLPHAKVTIIAEKFTTETTSDGAAGIFRPGIAFRGPNLEITKQWLNDAYVYFNDILKSTESDQAGIKDISGYIISSKYPTSVRNEFLEAILPDYRPCTEEELQMCPGNWQYGSHFTTLVVDCRRHLPWLTKKFESQGGVIIEQKVNSFEELSNYDLVCNCSGFGARELCGDTLVTPIRGQVFKVSAPWIKEFFYADYDTYIIPGFESVTLGGCRGFDSWNEELCKHDAAAIWERCVSLLPSLKDAKVIREWVGWRPYRPFVRVESEVMTFPSGKTIQVVHNYGHGGYGVMSAPGTSIHAVKIAKEILTPNAKL
ncbi:unnamed protein product [Meganyctiphanes norvegica]|uniref:FAD dependent oxidoreductase domain-containing protein n=1 Tax=Meganyctiphanes norvegica TaxID=48144 RepID=A0AAV2QRU0_MEGNR